VFNRRVATVVSDAVAQAAIDSGVARRDRTSRSDPTSALDGGL
jgi:malic enzyme